MIAIPSATLVVRTSVFIGSSFFAIWAGARALIQPHKQHQSRLPQAFLGVLSSSTKRRSGRRRKRSRRPKRLERNFTEVADVETRLSARWRALPPRHCSAPHCAERRRDNDLDNCRSLHSV